MDSFTAGQLIIILPGLFLIGFVFSMFGRGGGEFIVPFLISVVALPFWTAREDRPTWVAGRLLSQASRAAGDSSRFGGRR